MNESSGMNILGKKVIDKFISIHVHKSGGTTLGFILEDLYGDKFFWDKSEDTVNLHGRPKHYDLEEIREYDVVHGHVHVNKYQYLERPYITWIRYPVDRLESEYSIIRQKRITARSSPFHKRIIKEKLEFLDYCQVHREVYARYLGNYTIKNFAFIGITEMYKESLHVLSKVIGKKIPPYFRRNTRKMKRQWFKKGTAEERQACAELNTRDIDFYKQAEHRLLAEFQKCRGDFNEEDYEPLEKVPGKRYYK